MKWRKEPPDKPGWWWMRGPGGKPCVVEAKHRNPFGRAGLYVLVDGSWSLIIHWFGCQWAGPIAEPEGGE